jgi:hypothetical protein
LELEELEAGLDLYVVFCADVVDVAEAEGVGRVDRGQLVD